MGIIVDDHIALFTDSAAAFWDRAHIAWDCARFKKGAKPVVMSRIHDIDQSGIADLSGWDFKQLRIDHKTTRQVATIKEKAK